ncbi:anti-sigma factor [Pararhizobium haloflavum]|uniref:anti-sigma factor n=1 Tax=Pararhizobium haloflavum TaxID=2037914 RepID=UPI001FE04360|nr:anti-sigma factor [Pararhizobium haloflavum]
MTSTTTPMDGQNLLELADEYALGLLDAQERAQVEDALLHDDDLRRAVDNARDRFHELDLTAEPVTPSPHLWENIETAAAERVDDGPPLPSASGARTVTAANDNAVRRWRWAALAGIAASLVLAVGLLRMPSTTPSAAVIAVLVDEAGEPLVIVEDFGDRSTRVTPLVDVTVPAGQTMQLWTLPDEETGPVSLGLIEEPETMILDDGPQLPAPQADQLYEITIEQDGGSPTGRPTGEILGKGFAKQPR